MKNSVNLASTFLSPKIISLYLYKNENVNKCKI